jgi:spore coat protein U-like protein
MLKVLARMLARRGLRPVVGAALAALAGAMALPAAAQGTATLSVSAVVLSRNVCMFRNVPGNQPHVLAFGDLDPAASGNASAIASSVEFVCRGSSPIATFSISQNGGLHSTGGPNGNRMKHATADEFLPYTLALSPAAGSVPRNQFNTLTITGTVLLANYRAALAGDYSDTVVLTINP